MVNISDRWKRDKTDDLQFAFFNGIGWHSWENVWGIWKGITPRDSEATRRVETIERGVAPFLVSKDWEPFCPMLHFGVFASSWPMGEETVWTIINRNEYNITGPEMELPVHEGMHYFDLYHGVELTPERRGDKAVLTFSLGAKDYGAVLATRSALTEKRTSLMAAMKTLTDTALSILSDRRSILLQQMAEVASTKPPSATPTGMVKIPGGDFLFKVHGVEIEGFDDIGVDVQYPWEDSPRRYHA